MEKPRIPERKFSIKISLKEAEEEISETEKYLTYSVTNRWNQDFIEVRFDRIKDSKAD